MSFGQNQATGVRRNLIKCKFETKFETKHMPRKVNIHPNKVKIFGNFKSMHMFKIWTPLESWMFKIRFE